MARTECGTISAIIEMPDVWPPLRPITTRIDLEDGCLTVEIGYGRRIRVSLVKLDHEVEHVIAETVSCRLFSEPGSRLILMVTWSKNLRLTANGDVLIGSDDPTEETPPAFRIASKPIDPDKIHDYSAKNAKVLLSRKGGIKSLETDGLIPENVRKHMMDSLKAEADQIRDLLALIRAGSTSHARGLGGRLRVMLGDANQWPLLLTCAAIKNVPLIAYTRAARLDLLDFSKLAALSSFITSSISSEPRRLNINPIDIGVWLKTPAMFADGKIISQQKLINVIGNTIGNHLDPN